MADVDYLIREPSYIFPLFCSDPAGRDLLYLLGPFLGLLELTLRIVSRVSSPKAVEVRAFCAAVPRDSALPRFRTPLMHRDAHKR
jgi:hypothetical protein